MRDDMQKAPLRPPRDRPQGTAIDLTLLFAFLVLLAAIGVGIAGLAVVTFSGLGAGGWVPSLFAPGDLGPVLIGLGTVDVVILAAMVVRSRRQIFD